ncbi:hypothetical protein NHQ30_000215 [Ciborinia camelliae]|nr:hypothetical protein NHQ30_000215 [Ciborinia camelliae]
MVQSRKKKPGKHRVPDHKRKRARVSCDRCKNRRVRCSRVGTRPCQNCAEAQVACEFNSPRLTRVYGSVETLSERFRMLNALIEGLFPSQDTTDITVLYDLAQRNGVTLPDSTVETPVEDVFAQVPKNRAASLADSDASQQTMRDEPTPTDKSITLPNSPRDRLVPIPSGKSSHFIGASSSFGFVLTCRKMVQEYVDVRRRLHPDDPVLSLMTSFAESRWSKALEPKVAEEKHTAPGPADLERDAHSPKRSHVISVVKSKGLSGEAPLSSLIPAREIADDLIGSFFDRVHPSFLLFRRRSFGERYGLMLSELDHTDIQDVEVGWLCSVLMVMVLGAQALQPHEAYMELIRQYVEWVEDKISQLLFTSSLVNIQALLLLQLYQHNSSERNKAFMMLGAASRMAINLGIHRDAAIKDLDPIESQVQRRVWWTIYQFEHNSCTILGRPSSIDDTEVTVKFPDEELLDGSECVPRGYVEWMYRLSKIMADISKKMYPSSSIPDRNAEKIRIRIANGLLSDLDDWHDRLPQHLRADYQISSSTHTRAVCLLHLQFYLTQSLVVRPFLLRKVALQLARKLGKHVHPHDIDDEEVALSSKCCLFSKKALLFAHKLINSRQFNGVTWIDPYFVYHSVFVIALNSLAKDEPDTEEEISGKNAVYEIKNAMDYIRLCPLFAMLTQVAFQLAEIVGIVDNDESNAKTQQIDTRNLEPNVQAIPDIDFGFESSEQASMGVINFFVQGDHVNLPWRAGPDNFTHIPQVAAPMIGALPDRNVPIMDAHAVATTMQGRVQGQMQSPQPYGNWADGYEGMHPQTRRGSTSANPSHFNGTGNGNSHARAQYGNPRADQFHGRGHAQFRNQSGPSHIYAHGNANGNGHSQFGNQSDPSHIRATGHGYAQPQYANPQAGPSRSNFSRRILDPDYEMAMNN